MFIASTHDYLLIFTDKGRCHWLKVFEIPEGGRIAKGKSINNVISKDPEEKIASFIAVKEFDDKHYVFMFSQQGLVKKVVLSEFSNPRRSGIVAANLKKGDQLTDVKLTDGTQDIVIGTYNGMAIRFKENEIRPMGRTAAGVRGIRLGKSDKVVGAVNLRRRGTTILVATQKGFGKRSEEEEYRVSHRGGKGIFTVKTSEKTGKMVAIKEALDTDDIVIVTSEGMIIRQHASDIRVAGRNTQGVRLIRLKEGDTIADVAVVIAEDEEEKQLAEQEKDTNNEKASLKKKEENIIEEEVKQENLTVPSNSKGKAKKPAKSQKSTNKKASRKK
jgi:DNA gyrase subunit A